MSPHLLALIGVRCVGLLMVLLPIPEIWHHAHRFVCLCAGNGLWSTITGWPPLYGDPSSHWANLGPVVQLGAGLYLLLGGKRVARLVARHRPGACTACGYDLRGTDAVRCPECGTPIERPARA